MKRKHKVVITISNLDSFINTALKLDKSSNLFKEMRELIIKTVLEAKVVDEEVLSNELQLNGFLQQSGLALTDYLEILNKISSLMVSDLNSLNKLREQLEYRYTEVSTSIVVKEHIAIVSFYAEDELKPKIETLIEELEKNVSNPPGIIYTLLSELDDYDQFNS